MLRGKGSRNASYLSYKTLFICIKYQKSKQTEDQIFIGECEWQWSGVEGGVVTRDKHHVTSAAI